MKYEYRLKKYKGTAFLEGRYGLPEIENQFNIMGLEGWELISILDISQELGSAKSIVATFKRMKK